MFYAQKMSEYVFFQTDPAHVGNFEPLNGNIGTFFIIVKGKEYEAVHFTTFANEYYSRREIDIHCT